MKTDLIINSKAGNKAVAKTITNVNPEVTNDKLETFAGMVNALSTNTYQNASRVDKKDVTEADTPTPSAGKRFPTLSVYSTGGHYGDITYDGDGTLTAYASDGKCTINLNENTVYGSDGVGVICASETENCYAVWSPMTIHGGPA